MTARATLTLLAFRFVHSYPPRDQPDAVAVALYPASGVDRMIGHIMDFRNSPAVVPAFTSARLMSANIPPILNATEGAVGRSSAPHDSSGPQLPGEVYLECSKVYAERWIEAQTELGRTDPASEARQICRRHTTSRRSSTCRASQF
jgi:hypothetical protein